MTAIRAMARGVCCLLAAALLAVSSAAGETEKTGQAEETGNTVSREERMAEARARYNEKTVNIYRNGHGKNQRGKINVRFYTSRDDNGVYINVRESLQIRDQDEMEAILELIVKNENYDPEEHGTIAFMKAQWIAHNIAHSLATGTEGQQKLIGFFTGESIAKVVSSSKELDITPYRCMTEEQKTVYRMIEIAFGSGGD